MLKVGLVSAAHVHAGSYARILQGHTEARAIGVWDDRLDRRESFATQWGLPMVDGLEDLVTTCDAVIVCSENLKHGEHIEAAVRAGKPVLCEKPLAASAEEVGRISQVLKETQSLLMTAFPCPFSPVFDRLSQRLRAGEVGKILAISATNRGKCPFGWFTDKGLSGGGAMIDHVVHVADLLWRILEERPSRVVSQVGNNMYGEEWEDTAHLTLDFPSGVFATLDSSWSRHQNYRTWGDVTLRVTGEKGVIEADLFGQGLSVTTEQHRLYGTGSDLDALMLNEFFAAIRENRPPLTTAEDGLRASEVCLLAAENAVSA